MLPTALRIPSLMDFRVNALQSYMLRQSRCPQAQEKRSTRRGTAQLGRARRTVISRISQGSGTAKQRDFDLVDLLVSSQRGRITSLLPLKFARMAASPFGFYPWRGPVMAADLARGSLYGN